MKKMVEPEPEPTVTVHTISLDDLRLLTYFANSLNNKRVFDDGRGECNANCIFTIFMPVWKLNNAYIMSQIQEILHVLAVSGIRTVYMVQIEGSDDAEDYVVDRLKLPDVPALMVYDRMIHFDGLGDEDFDPNQLRFPDYVSVIRGSSSSNSSSSINNNNSSSNSNSNSSNSSNSSSNSSSSINNNNISSNSNSNSSNSSNSSSNSSNSINNNNSNSSNSIDLLIQEILINNKRNKRYSSSFSARYTSTVGGVVVQSPAFASSQQQQVITRPPPTTINRNSTAIIKALFSNKYSNYSTSNSSSDGLTLFIGGDRSQVGKSSISYGILSTLVEVYGVDPSKLAYIKPVTQCEAEQLITQYCQQVGIDCRAIGPVVFYSGFTRSFLRGETESLEDLRGHVLESVSSISRGKVLTIVDGVGYPAVGSICGICNGTVVGSNPDMLV